MPHESSLTGTSLTGVALYYRFKGLEDDFGNMSFFNIALSTLACIVPPVY
jgi:hypothetical protein